MNKENLQYCEEYLSFLTEVRWLRQSSISTKRLHLLRFISFIGDRNISVLNIQEICAYIQYLKWLDRWFHSRYHYQGEGKMSLITIQNYMSTIRHFFKRSNSMWYSYKVDPVLIQSPKVSRRKIDPLSDKELEAILKAPMRFEVREDTKYRNTLLIYIGYYLWLRIHEAITLSFDDILSPDQEIQIKWKGKRNRVLHIPSFIQKLAKEYKEIREAIEYVPIHQTSCNGKPFVRYCKVSDQNPHLPFVSLDCVQYGKPMKRAITSVFFRRYEKALNIQKRITYHRLRHTFWRHLLNNNIDLYTIGQMLGHQTIYATQYYLKADSKKVMMAQKSLFDLWSHKKSIITDHNHSLSLVN